MSEALRQGRSPLQPEARRLGKGGTLSRDPQHPRAARTLLSQDVLDWLLGGDPAISFQTRRDLLCRAGATPMQRRIATEGWGAALLAARRPDGHWGSGFHRPKWTSTHYTLLDLAMLGLPPDDPKARESAGLVLDAPRGADGGINFAASLPVSDVCINGMILAYASHFRPHDDRLEGIADYLLGVLQPDGGWNCEYHHGSVVSSLHTTMSTLEGLLGFRRTGSGYRSGAIDGAIRSGGEFILSHRLFRSRRTGEVIDPRFLRLSYPPRWRFDILRALDFFRNAGWHRDPRMSEALRIIGKKRRPDGRWTLAAPHRGAVHIQMEKAGEPSRWNTLRALRVLTSYGEETTTRAWARGS